jgi:hypothetical protein
LAVVAAYDKRVTCRACGAEIAEKAIVCYRCGTPTAVPAPAKPAAPASSRPWFLAIVAIMVAALTVVAAQHWPDFRTTVSIVGGLLAVMLAALAVARWPRG